MRRDHRDEGLLGEPVGDVLPPSGEDVVADEDVVDLLDAADGGDDAGLDLLLGEGVSREAGGEGGEGFGGGLLVDDDDLLGDVRIRVLGAWVGEGVGGGRRRGREGGKVRRKRDGRGRGGRAAADAGALALGLEGDLEVEVRAGVKVKVRMKVRVRVLRDQRGGKRRTDGERGRRRRERVLVGHLLLGSASSPALEPAGDGIRRTRHDLLLDLYD